MFQDPLLAQLVTYLLDTLIQSACPRVRVSREGLARGRNGKVSARALRTRVEGRDFEDTEDTFDCVEDTEDTEARRVPRLFAASVLSLKVNANSPSGCP